MDSEWFIPDPDPALNFPRSGSRQKFRIHNTFSIGNPWNSQFEQFPSRPKFKLFTSFEEAGTAVQKAENEFLALLKQKGYNTDTVNQPQPARAGDGLTTIRQDQLLLYPLVLWSIILVFVSANIIRTVYVMLIRIQVPYNIFRLLKLFKFIYLVKKIRCISELSVYGIPYIIDSIGKCLWSSQRKLVTKCFLICYT